MFTHRQVRPSGGPRSDQVRGVVGCGAPHPRPGAFRAPGFGRQPGSGVAGPGVAVARWDAGENQTLAFDEMSRCALSRSCASSVLIDPGAHLGTGPWFLGVAYVQIYVDQ